MIVRGHEITSEEQAKVIAFMRQKGEFTAGELNRRCEEIGFVSTTAMRLADRMIQRQRKVGNISLIQNPLRWKWIRNE